MNLLTYLCTFKRNFGACGLRLTLFPEISLYIAIKEKELVIADHSILRVDENDVFVWLKIVEKVKNYTCMWRAECKKWKADFFCSARLTKIRHDISYCIVCHFKELLT